MTTASVLSSSSLSLSNPIRRLADGVYTVLPGVVAISHCRNDVEVTHKSRAWWWCRPSHTSQGYWSGASRWQFLSNSLLLSRVSSSMLIPVFCFFFEAIDTSNRTSKQSSLERMTSTSAVTCNQNNYFPNIHHLTTIIQLVSYHKKKISLSRNVRGTSTETFKRNLYK